MAAGQKTGGRQRGTPNRATADIKALAQAHAATAITELARLAVEAQSEPARVAAIKELLDRGFGKATQAVDVNADVRFGAAPGLAEFAKLIRGGA